MLFRVELIASSFLDLISKQAGMTAGCKGVLVRRCFHAGRRRCLIVRPLLIDQQLTIPDATSFLRRD